MKRWKKVLLGTMGVLLIAAAALGFWRRNDLKAVYTFLTQDSAAIAENLEQQREEHQQALQEKFPLQVTPPTAAQSDGLLSGSVTAEEVKEALGISAQLAAGEGVPTEEELVNRCVAELYAYKVDIMAALGELKQEAVEEWLALRPEERTETRKREIGLDGLSECYDLEVVADAQVKEILDRYRAQLKAIGSGTSILDELWDYYEAEKAAEKAYYMDQYLG